MQTNRTGNPANAHRIDDSLQSLKAIIYGEHVVFTIRDRCQLGRKQMSANSTDKWHTYLTKISIQTLSCDITTLRNFFEFKIKTAKAPDKEGKSLLHLTCCCD